MPLAYIPVYMLKVIQALEAQGFKVDAHDEKGNANLYKGTVEVIVTESCTSVDLNGLADKSVMCAIHYNPEAILCYPNMILGFLKSMGVL